MEREQQIEQFVKNREIDRDRVEELLTTVMQRAVMERIETEFGVKKLLYSNLERWSNLILKIKPMQRLNAYLVEEITKILEAEIKHNSEVIKVFLEIPRENEEQLV